MGYGMALPDMREGSDEALPVQGMGGGSYEGGGALLDSFVESTAAACCVPRDGFLYLGLPLLSF